MSLDEYESTAVSAGASKSIAVRSTNNLKVKVKKISPNASSRQKAPVSSIKLNSKLPLYQDDEKIHKLQNFLTESVNRVRSQEIDYEGSLKKNIGHYNNLEGAEKDFHFPINPAMVNKVRTKKPLNYVYQYI